MAERENVILIKSKTFAIIIINLYKYLVYEKKEYILSKQILRSGTSIGANIRETINAQSDKDFLSKMNIALKETNETQYWLELLNETNFIEGAMFRSIMNDCNEIEKILASIVKTMKEKQEKLLISRGDCKTIK